jgi:cytochrome P450
VNAASTRNPSTKPLGPTGKESVYSLVLSNPNLPPAEKSLQRLEQEGALLVLAGTESPARTLTIIFFHLLSNPSLLATLHAELATVPNEASWIELEKLPYLGAVIEEGNRLSWGVTARMARIAHEPLTYTPSIHASRPGKSYTIPSGTPLSTTTLSAHTSPSVFPSPYTFDPSRWLGDAGRERKKYQMAFSNGSRKCLGMELARAELYLVTARLVSGFELELYETRESEVAFVRDYQVAMPEVGCLGVRVVARRR